MIIDTLVDTTIPFAMITCSCPSQETYLLENVQVRQNGAVFTLRGKGMELLCDGQYSITSYDEVMENSTVIKLSEDKFNCLYQMYRFLSRQ